MLNFNKLTLQNGLRVLVHSDKTIPTIAFNLLYGIGSKHENPNRTGFAHLFEHLMFAGSANVPNFDQVIEKAGGENNAFTSTDVTSFFINIPKDNLETAFWVESDRMFALNINQKSLDIQKSVVIEEFNQRYLNQPYGDTWLLLRPLAYKVHPYQWATIGKDPEHIAGATLQDVTEFYQNYYTPNNAILCVSGNVDAQEVFRLADKWFGSIPKGTQNLPVLPKEPAQTEKRLMKVSRNVPLNAIYKAYHMGSRKHADFPTTDLISDILSNGKSSRLFQNLVKKEQVFHSIDAYITGEMEEGLFIVAGTLNNGQSYEAAEKAIEKELTTIQSELVTDYELDKVKNKFESAYTFGLINPTDVALGLCQYELLGNAELINSTTSSYRKVSKTDIQRVANTLFAENNCSTLYYKAQENK